MAQEELDGLVKLVTLGELAALGILVALEKN